MATYTVVKGDTLWAIAQKHLGDGKRWREILNANPNAVSRAGDPTTLKIGAKLNIPGGTTGGGGGPAAKSPEALPRNSSLVKVGNQYRVIWNLGDNLGWAWYSINSKQLNDLYGTSTPTANVVLSNTGQFESRYGNNHWGNVAEVNLKHDNPWEDLKERIFNQFGFVPGLDDKDIRRLLIQAHFEDWTQNQFIVEYRKTDFYKSTTDAQRQWLGLSPAEKEQRIRQTTTELANSFRALWGRGFSAGPNEPDLRHFAQRIASGQMTMAEWEFDQRRQASKEKNTPAWREEQAEREAQREFANRVSNLTNFASDQWRQWVGPIDIPKNFASRWGNWLANAEKSNADLENELKRIAQARWQFKPEDVTWEDWASTFKSQIRSTLELGSVDDNDGLLSQILNTDLNGVDVNRMIRNDQRFLATRTMFGELSNQVEDVGRRFGFIT